MIGRVSSGLPLLVGAGVGSLLMIGPSAGRAEGSDDPFPGAVQALVGMADVGRDERVPPSSKPTVQATFMRESYSRGEVARLVFLSEARRVSVVVVHAGTERHAVRGNDEMTGAVVTPLRQLGSVGVGRPVDVPVGDWPSGLYVARVTAAGGRVGYAPFVLRPRKLGEHRVAVVLPTQTWQAYNFRDDDADGRPDTWYGDPYTNTARIARPFENRGTPPHYRQYDEPFLRWLAATGRRPDFLADRDLDRLTGDALSRAYTLVVFAGHHEYVTAREYDAVTRYRNLGGHLMFLSANNFFYRVDLRANEMTRVGKWRDLGRPEAALIGVQYLTWSENRFHSRPYIVAGARARPWIFAGTGLRNGDRFGTGGIEVDARTASSPRGTTLLAAIPGVFGPGTKAEMTYYETNRGAKVFAAGAFSVAASIWQPAVRRLVANLWLNLSGEQATLARSVASS